MKNTLKLLVFSAVLLAGLTPVGTMAKEEPVVKKESKPFVATEELVAVKKAFKLPQLTIDKLFLKKAYIAAVKKVEAVSSVYEDATSIPSTAYFAALEKAATQYAKDRAKAGGNKKKLEAADEAYAQTVEEATELYLIPIDDQS